MSLQDSAIRRWTAGRDVVVAFAVLAVVSVLAGAVFVPAYLAILAASGLRNVLLPSLGDGVLFWGVAALALYVQAVALAALYRGGRALYRRRDGGDAGSAA
jgi:hypothetical protein